MTEEAKGANPKSKPIKQQTKWVILFILIFISIGGFVIYSLYGMDSKPKELYLQTERNAYEDTMEHFKEKYGDSLRFKEAMLAGPSSSEINLTGSMKEITSDHKGLAFFLTILNQTDMDIHSIRDPENEVSYHTIHLQNENSKMNAAEIIQSSEQLGVKFPVLYDRFFYLNVNEYGDFASKYDQNYAGPEELDISRLNWGDLELSKGELNQIKLEYGTYLLDELKDDYFSLENNVEYESMTVKELTLEMSGEEVKSVLTGLMEKFLDDDELQHIIAERMIHITHAIKLDVDPEKINESQVKEDIIKRVSQWKQALAGMELEKFKSVILVDEADQIVDRQMELYGDENRFQFTTKSHGTHREGIIETQNASIELSQENIEKSNGIEEVIELALRKEDKDQHPIDMNLTINSEYSSDAANQQQVEREIRFQRNGETEDALKSGTITQEKSINLNSNLMEQRLVLDINHQGQDYSIQAESTTELLEQVSYPTITESNGENMVELTDDDLYRIIYEEIGGNFQEFMKVMDVF
ncbi:hypothetical protein SAMN05216389_10763 [Oceanobacillus limi]|uniref:Uncharacterized protein n=1 Tax=Oceanobacillus limi TaxID=930131 RepID=A0A1I0CTT2_9BACI|nr:DUF6583 family protein [Oceanobacillus limi]SET22797.1 hypothetical protein SAMN05216389_10763 [Oceanobacillus limi]